MSPMTRASLMTTDPFMPAEHVTWRLCFYINLPIGLITATYLLLFFHSKARAMGESHPLTRSEKLRELDLAGLFTFLPALICLLLALQWAGSTYAWGNARIIVLFIVAGLCAIAFVAIQIWKGDRATIPPSMVKIRTVWSGATYVFFLGGAYIVITYYIAIWFQGIQGVSPLESGIRTLPSILASMIASIVTGGIVANVGYYTWATILCSILATTVSAVLSMSWQRNTDGLCPPGLRSSDHFQA